MTYDVDFLIALLAAVGDLRARAAVALKPDIYCSPVRPPDAAIVPLPEVLWSVHVVFCTPVAIELLVTGTPTASSSNPPPNVGNEPIVCVEVRNDEDPPASP